MRMIITGRDLPGRTFRSGGEVLENVHVGVQLGRQPHGLVPADADGAEWELDVRTVVGPGDAIDFRGPAVHGPRGDRFVYLTWGNLGVDGSFAVFRRAKLMLHRIDDALVRGAHGDAALALRAEVTLTEAKGCPRCARVDPPAIRWSAAGRGP